MTISWRRCTQPENVISRNASSGGTEPMPEVYRTRSFEFLDSTGPQDLDAGKASQVSYKDRRVLLSVQHLQVALLCLRG